MAEPSSKVQAALKHLRRPVQLESLSAPQRRSLIATDALAALHAEKVRASRGRYVALEDNPDRVSRLVSSDGSIAGIIAESNCQVCAIGACFVATIARSPQKYSWSNFKHEASVGSDDLRMGDSVMRQILHDHFEPLQLALMEAAFECSAAYVQRAGLRPDDPIVESAVGEAVRFGYRYDTDVERLEAILENVIANCGEFKP